jgi:predicted enzyme related to lactoylglutathione lyase
VSAPLGTPGHLLVPVDDVGAAVAFYTEVLGLELRFRDGDRYAAVRVGALTIGLAAPGEAPPGGGVALSLKVDDLDAAVERLQAGGAEIVGGVERGPHELRVAFRDPAGNVTVAYQPLTAG